MHKQDLWQSKTTFNRTRFPTIPDWKRKVKGDWANKVWTIDESTIENGGVTEPTLNRQKCFNEWTSLERAIEEGVIKGQVYYFRGPGHGWAVFRDQARRDFVIDAAQNFWGPIEGNKYWAGKDEDGNDVHISYSDWTKRYPILSRKNFERFSEHKQGPK